MRFARRCPRRRAQLALTRAPGRPWCLHPAAARGAGYDNFTCAPVRFECASGDRTDPWAHMQLDALGLFLTAYGTLAQAGHLAPDAGLVRRGNGAAIAQTPQRATAATAARVAGA